MFKKGSKLYSIVKNKCPQCHEGDFFETNNLFQLRKLIKLHDRCDQCDFKYMMEPSFFYGAMFINYGLTVGLGIAMFIVSNLLIGLNLLQSFLSIAGIIILFTPITIRLSRLIWINIFVKFKKNAKLNDLV